MATSLCSLSIGHSALDTQSEQKANELKVPVMKKYTQQLSADTDKESNKDHTPTISSHAVETNGVNLSKLSSI